MVEIIPKTFEEIPSWQRILFYFLIFLLIAVVVGFFVLNYLYDEAKDDLQVLEKTLSEEKAPEIETLEEEVFAYKKKFDDFSFLFENHTLTTRFFEFLESKTHPRIFFSNIYLRPGQSEVNLSGLSDNFSSLGQQVSILKNEKLVKNVILSNVAISEKGDIDFSLKIFLKEELFEHSTNSK